MKLEITKEKVLAAAKKCSTVKEVLTGMFPEAFEGIIEYDEKKIYAYQSKNSDKTIYKLHRCGDFYAFISMRSSSTYSDGRGSAEDQIRRAKDWAIDGEVHEFNGQYEFIEWSYRMIINKTNP